MVRQVPISSTVHLLRSERGDKHVLKRRTARGDRGRICFAIVFAGVVGKNPNTPI